MLSGYIEPEPAPVHVVTVNLLPACPGLPYPCLPPEGAFPHSFKADAPLLSFLLAVAIHVHRPWRSSEPSGLFGARSALKCSLAAWASTIPISPRRLNLTLNPFEQKVVTMWLLKTKRSSLSFI